MNYFIALLPKVSDILYDKIINVLEFDTRSEVNFPLHVTLRYFYFLQDPRIIKNWVTEFEKNPSKSFHATVTEVSFFEHQGQEEVYFLDVCAHEIYALYQKLTVLKSFSEEIFPFHPHISLVFPKQNLLPEEKKKIQDIFADIRTIEFDRLALFSEKNNTFKIEKIVSLKKI